jgi:hypothetical protein
MAVENGLAKGICVEMLRTSCFLRLTLAPAAIVGGMEVLIQELLDVHK